MRASDIAPSGKLRVGLNYQNFLLVAGDGPDVDRKGVRIAVSERSAYDLYLSRYLKQAEIVRAPGIAASFDWFVERKLEVLAGLKPKLMEENARLPGSRILEGQITGVQQSIA